MFSLVVEEFVRVAGRKRTRGATRFLVVFFRMNVMDLVDK